MLIHHNVFNCQWKVAYPCCADSLRKTCSSVKTFQSIKGLNMSDTLLMLESV